MTDDDLDRRDPDAFRPVPSPPGIRAQQRRGRVLREPNPDGLEDGPARSRFDSPTVAKGETAAAPRPGDVRLPNGRVLDMRQLRGGRGADDGDRTPDDAA